MSNAKRTLKTDNSNLETKLNLRRLLLGEMKEDLVVIDACAGDQCIWNVLKAEYNVKKYLPIDIGGRKNALKLDALHYFQNTTNDCNVIDIDTYGEPWEIYHTALNSINRNVKKVAIFLTRGVAQTHASFSFSKYSLKIARIPQNYRLPGRLKLIYFLDKICLLHPFCENSPWKIERACMTRFNKVKTTYYGLLIKST
jgi:hypothetical protein